MTKRSVKSIKQVIWLVLMTLSLQGEALALAPRHSSFGEDRAKAKQRVFQDPSGGEISLRFFRGDGRLGTETYEMIYRRDRVEENFGSITLRASKEGIRVSFIHLTYAGRVSQDELNQLRQRVVSLFDFLSSEAGESGGALIVDDQDFIRNWGMGRILREQYPYRVDFSPEEHGFILRPTEKAEGVRVNWGALPANFQIVAEGIFTNFQKEDLVGQLHAALTLSEQDAWNPDLNRVAETLTEINPQDYLARKPKAQSRRYNRSGWVTMPDRILTIAEAQVEGDVARMEEAIRRAHPDMEGDPIRYVIWAGMGGSAEIGKTINSPEILKFATKDRKIFILDSTDKEAVKGILMQMIEREEAIRRANKTLPNQVGKAYYEELLREALKRTVVLGVSMGMTSEEPVINLTVLETIYSNMLGMPAAQAGAHFWGMTLKGSTVHEFLKVKGWDDHRLAIQLDGEARSTLSGRNSYDSRVALLHLGFLGIPIKSYLAAQSAPHFTDKERWQAFRLSAALATAEAAGLNQPTLLLHDSLKPCAYLLMQQTEESSGKNGAHLMKMDVPHRLSWDLLKPVGDRQQRRVFIHVTVNGEDDPHLEDVKRLKKEGYWVVEVNLPKAEGALGALPTFLHYWTHVVLGLGYYWGNDTVGQYYVELYKKYVQLFILEAMGRGGFGEYSFENVNTPEVTEAKQRWLKRPDPQVGSLKDTKPWVGLMASAHKAEFEGATLYFDGILEDAPRYYRENLGRALRSIGASSLERANAAEIYAGLMLLASRDETASFAELIYYGDLVHTERGRLLRARLEDFAREVSGKFAGLLTHVVEGPRDNHSRLEMSTAGKNEGIITLITRSLLPIKAGYPMPASDENSLDGYLERIIASYPIDYLPMQILATYQSYLKHNRRVVLIEGDVTSEWVAKFLKEVQRLLSIPQTQRFDKEINAAL